MLQIGSSAPNFFLNTISGVEVGLTACLLEGPVLIEFIRGTWDPDARRRLQELAGASERFRELGARILVVTCERSGQVAKYLERHPSPLAVLLDEERRVAREYRVLQRFALPVWNIARPSSFVVDRCGFVRFAYAARLSIHTAEIEKILAVLRAL